MQNRVIRIIPWFVLGSMCLCLALFVPQNPFASFPDPVITNPENYSNPSEDWSSNGADDSGSQDWNNTQTEDWEWNAGIDSDSWYSDDDSGSWDSWDSGGDSGSWDSWDSGSDSGSWDSWDSGSDSGSWDSW